MSDRSSLDDFIDKQLGVVPAYMIAEMLDDPGIEGRVRSLRNRDVGLRLTQEGLSAFQTYALLSVVDHPELYGMGLLADTTMTVAQHRIDTEFRYGIGTKLREKMFELVPYHREVTVALEDRGHPNANFFGAFWGAIKVERKKFGLEKLLTITRPCTQAVAALAKIVPEVVIPATLAAYATVPLFRWLGERDKIIEDRMSVMDHIGSRAKLLNRGWLKDKMYQARARFLRKWNTNTLAQHLQSKISEYAFFATALIAKTDAMGVFQYIRQLTSTPMSFRMLREDELETERSLGLVRSAYQIVSGNPYFFTDVSWDRYREEKLPELDSVVMEDQGIEVRDLQTLIPDKESERYTPSLSFSAKPGDIVWLKAQSGAGKSVTTGLGFAGILQTKGCIYIKDNDGEARPLEALTRGEVRRRIWYVAPAYGFDELRVCDVYQSQAGEEYLNRINKNESELSDFEVMMLTMPDNLLERELYAMAREMKSKGIKRDYHGYDDEEQQRVSLEGVKALLDYDQFDNIYLFRQTRKEIVQDLLRSKGSNFAKIKADQAIGTLSTGMRTRFMWELHNELYGTSAGDGKTNVVIIDEPFGALDPQNTREYLQEINKLTGNGNPPIVVLISHTREELIREELDGSRLKEVYFNES